jgi:hypothetical protein
MVGVNREASDHSRLLHCTSPLLADFVAKVLMVSVNSDSVALMRFAAEAGDDGAAQSRPRAAVLSILP